MSKQFSKHTYRADAKAAVERVVSGFEMSRPRLVIDFDPTTRTVISATIRMAPNGAAGRVDGGATADWPIAGLSGAAMGVDEFRGFLSRAVDTYGRRRRKRPAVARAEQATSAFERFSAPLDVFVASRPRSGRA